MLNLVYVNLPKEHYKEDTTWYCDTADEALRLTRWLNNLGLDAQRIDQEIFEAMPDKLGYNR